MRTCCTLGTLLCVRTLLSCIRARTAGMLGPGRSHSSREREREPDAQDVSLHQQKHMRSSACAPHSGV